RIGEAETDAGECGERGEDQERERGIVDPALKEVICRVGQPRREVLREGVIVELAGERVQIGVLPGYQDMRCCYRDELLIVKGGADDAAQVYHYYERYSASNKGVRERLGGPLLLCR